MKNDKHKYLVELIREIEKRNPTLLGNMIVKIEEVLATRAKLHRYIDYPIRQPQYDTLIAYAEELIGVGKADEEVSEVKDLNKEIDEFFDLNEK